MSPAPTARARPSPICAPCLEAAGYRVHVYTSPHLVRFHERIRLAGKLIDEDGAARAARRNASAPMPARRSPSSRSPPRPPSSPSPARRPTSCCSRPAWAAGSTPPTSSTSRRRPRSRRSRFDHHAVSRRHDRRRSPARRPASSSSGRARDGRPPAAGSAGRLRGAAHELGAPLYPLRRANGRSTAGCRMRCASPIARGPRQLPRAGACSAASIRQCRRRPRLPHLLGGLRVRRGGHRRAACARSNGRRACSA